MNEKQETQYWSILKGGYVLAEGYMDFGKAHNEAIEFANGNKYIEKRILENAKDEPVEVVETFGFGCCKCGDSYFTTVESERPKGRWRCGACVYAWL